MHLMRRGLRTNRALEVDVAQTAGEEEADFHGALVGIPDAHAVVSNHSAHSMVTCLVPLLLAQLQHLSPWEPNGSGHQRIRMPDELDIKQFGNDAIWIQIQI